MSTTEVVFGSIIVVLSVALSVCCTMLFGNRRKDDRAVEMHDKALKLAHDVANDAMIHLSAKNPIQAVQATAEKVKIERQDEREQEMNKWLADRAKRDYEEEQAKRHEQGPIEIKGEVIGADGQGIEKVLDLRDYEHVG